MSERWIVIPKWDEFQHYKDRDPAWIKAYTRLLSDEAYTRLTWTQRGLLHGLWLLYAKSTRRVPEDTLWLTHQLGQRVRKDSLEALNHAGLIGFADSPPIAPVYHRARPEKEKEKNPLPPTGKQSKPEPEPERVQELFRCQHGCTLDFKSARRRAEHHSIIHLVEEVA